MGERNRICSGCNRFLFSCLVCNTGSQKIAERQIKVDLFEKRYRVYRTLILCDSFSALVSISTELADIEIFFINLFVISLKNQRPTSISFLHLNMYKLPKLWLKANFYFQEIFGKM